jgi:hypothetical protein
MHVGICCVVSRLIVPYNVNRTCMSGFLMITRGCYHMVRSRSVAVGAPREARSVAG